MWKQRVHYLQGVPIYTRVMHAQTRVETAAAIHCSNWLPKPRSIDQQNLSRGHMWPVKDTVKAMHLWHTGSSTVNDRCQLAASKQFHVLHALSDSKDHQQMTYIYAHSTYISKHWKKYNLTVL